MQMQDPHVITHPNTHTQPHTSIPSGGGLTLGVKELSV